MTRPKRNIVLPGGFTTLVPIIATGITGTPVCRASRASPVLPLYNRPSGERVPSGYMPINLPCSNTCSAVLSAAWAASASARSIGTCPTAVKNHRLNQPFRPVPVKYSAFARKVIRRRTTSGRKKLSITAR